MDFQRSFCFLAVRTHEPHMGPAGAYLVTFLHSQERSSERPKARSFQIDIELSCLFACPLAHSTHNHRIV